MKVLQADMQKLHLDFSGKVGTNRNMVRFEPGQFLLPVNDLWAFTVYELPPPGLFSANPLSRYEIGICDTVKALSEASMPFHFCGRVYTLRWPDWTALILGIALAFLLAYGACRLWPRKMEIWRPSWIYER